LSLFAEEIIRPVFSALVLGAIFALTLASLAASPPHKNFWPHLFWQHNLCIIRNSLRVFAAYFCVFFKWGMCRRQSIVIGALYKPLASLL
jgi:hypothetical protein